MRQFVYIYTYAICAFICGSAQTNAQSIKYQLTNAAAAALSSDQFPIKTGGGLFHFSTHFMYCGAQFSQRKLDTARREQKKSRLRWVGAMDFLRTPHPSLRWGCEIQS